MNKIAIILLLKISVFTFGLGQGLEFLIKDINPGSNGSGPHLFMEFGSHIYFVAYVGNDAQIWRTINGRDSDTEFVVGGFIEISELDRAMGQLLFSATDATGDHELWRHTGTPGDPLVKIDINPSGSSSPRSIIRENSRIYFIAEQPTVGSQICSVSPSSFTTIATHTAPAPHNTGLFAPVISATPNTGIKSLVPTTNHIFVWNSGPNPAVLALPYAGGASAVPLVVTTTHVPISSQGMAPVGDKVCYNSGDFVCADASGTTTVGVGINPNYPTPYQGKVYVSGISSSNSQAPSLYCVDASLTLTEFPSIPARGAIGSASNLDWSLRPNIVQGKLLAFLNNFPGTTFGLYEVDVSTPTPTISLGTTYEPYNMAHIAHMDNHYYFQHIPFGTSTTQILKTNSTYTGVIAQNQNNDSYGEIIAYPARNMILYTGSESSSSFNCSGPPLQLGGELYKLNRYQTDCQQNVSVTASEIELGDVIVAGQSITITGSNTITTGLCTPMVSPLVTIAGSLNLVPPSQIKTYIGGCP